MAKADRFYFENFVAAAHLVRCHLDNIIRFSAFWIVNDPHEVATKIFIN